MGRGLAAFALIVGLLGSARAFACERPWLFFDLGNTLIDQAHPGGWAYFSEARAYLQDLKDKGYRLGLIVNIPPEWGKTPEERLLALKNAVLESWKGAEPFDWTLFDETEILLPAQASERKPAPALFDRAASDAETFGCGALFQGETEAEVSAAERSGMRAYQVGRPDHPFFMPEREIGLGLPN